MDTTLTTTINPVRVQRSGAATLIRSAASVLRSMQTAIVNGPSDGCWRPVDGAAQLSLMPTRERERQLDAGRAPNAR